SILRHGWNSRKRRSASAHSGCAYLTDVAEQVLQETALTSEGGCLIVYRINACDLLHSATVGADHIVGFVETDCQHSMASNLRGGERPLAGRARNVIPHRLTELTGEARLTERALDRLAVVDSGLDSPQDHFVCKVALVADDRAASRGEQAQA